jgi:hypothetical protein
MRHLPTEDTGRVLAAAVVIWAIAAALATAEGVFGRMAPAEFIALAAFAALYAPLTYRLDRGIRTFVLALPARRVIAAALLLDAVLAMAYAFGAPWPMLAMFGLPLAAAVHLALGERLWRERRALRRAPATSPGGSRAAT